MFLPNSKRNFCLQIEISISGILVALSTAATHYDCIRFEFEGLLNQDIIQAWSKVIESRSCADAFI